MVRAELLGLLTTTATRVAAVTALVGLLLTQLVLVTVLPALASGDIGPGAAALGDDLPPTDLATAAVQADALSPLGASAGGGSLGVAVVALALLGVLAGTSDSRYGGIVGAVLASPRRERLMAARAAAVGLTGLVLGAALVLVSSTTLAVTLGATGTAPALAPAVAAGVVGRGAVAVACLVLLGLAAGVLARDQLAGVLGVLAVLVGEPVLAATVQLVTGTVPVWAQLLPVALTHAAVGATPSALPPGAALAALAGLTALALAAATVALRRRDV
ncbi:hypothetical protein [Aquipuribacter hungaricus]|uniref:ABC-2 type transport system permease protein n=1 Tax=Aquipuribacter hungaricus TaxID=545624 RepID=A0ABV7WLG0_9MICO